MKRFATRETARYAFAALMLACGMLVAATAVGIMHDQPPVEAAPAARTAPAYFTDPVPLSESCGLLLAADGPMVAAIPLIMNIERIELSDGVATRGLARELADIRRAARDQALGYALDEAILIAEGRAEWLDTPGVPWKFGPRFTELDQTVRSVCAQFEQG